MFLINRNLHSFIDEGLLILRITMGPLMAIHGILKILAGAKTLTAIGSAISILGINEGFYFFGLIAALSELIGGTLVTIGLLTRIGALMVAATLAVATLVSWNNGFMAYSKPLEDLVVMIAIFITGPGRYSLDQAIFGGKK